jgi:transcriptional regulator with XRE-family HTH domain
MKTARRIIAEGVSKKLKQQRAEQGFTQEALAQRAQMSRETIRSIEAAEGAPEWETLESLAKALQLEFWDLMPERPQRKLRERDSNSQPTGTKPLASIPEILAAYPEDSSPTPVVPMPIEAA